MNRRGFAKLALTGAMLVAAVPIIFSHHSWAGFDMEQVQTVQGRVKEVQWTNPHCFIQVMVSAEAGPEEWSIEMHSPGVSTRMGWNRETLRPGDQVSVTFHPVRAGAPGGFLVSATDPAGKVHPYGRAP